MFFWPDYEGQFFFFYMHQSNQSSIWSEPYTVMHLLTDFGRRETTRGLARRHNGRNERIKMFFSNLQDALACQRRARTRQQLIERDSQGKNFSTSQNKKTSHSLISATHLPSCFISSWSPKFQFTFSENAKELCEHRAFTFVLYWFANTGPDGLFDKSWYW